MRSICMERVQTRLLTTRIIAAQLGVFSSSTGRRRAKAQGQGARSWRVDARPHFENSVTTIPRHRSASVATLR